LSDVTFSGGSPHIAAGKIVCVSSYDLMHEEAVYPLADSFQPARFLNESGSSNTKFTDVSENFPVWGHGALAW
jgi:cytochrome P450